MRQSLRLEPDCDPVRAPAASMLRGGSATHGIPPRRLAFYIGLLEARSPVQAAPEPDLVVRAEQSLRDLGASLAVLAGTEGYRALLQRALELAAVEFPTLATVETRTWPPGRVVGLRRSVRRLVPTEAKEALAQILVNVAWLLTRLIGRELAVVLLRQVWPQISAADLDLEPWGAADGGCRREGIEGSPGEASMA